MIPSDQTLHASIFPFIPYLTRRSTFFMLAKCVKKTKETMSTASTSDAPAGAAYLYNCVVGDKPVISHFFSADDPPVTPVVGAALEQVFDHARKSVGAPPSAQVNCSSVHALHVQPQPHVQPSTTPTVTTVTTGGSSSTPLKKPEFVKKRMAENCEVHGWRPIAVTSHNHFRCKYTGTGMVDGKEVSRPFMEWKGTLASCDQGDEFMEISDEVTDNIKEYVYWKAGGDEAKLDKDKFVCSIQSLPME